MDTLLKPLALLPWIDWLALVLFFAGWVGYAIFSRRLARMRPSILVTTNQWPPWAFIAATAAVLWVLYRRGFHSEVLGALRDGLAP